MSLTFDQLISVGVDFHDPLAIHPHQVIHGNCSFEPTSTGVHVSAKTSDGKMLWGLIATSDTLRERHTNIATYPELQRLIQDGLNSTHRMGISQPTASDTQLLSEFSSLMAELQDKAEIIQDDPGCEKSETLIKIIRDIEAFVSGQDLAVSGNRGAIVIEPSSAGLRITARSHHLETLWGYVACQETFREQTTLVAMYDPLETLLKNGLKEAQQFRVEESGMENAMLLLGFRRLIKDLSEQVCVVLADTEHPNNFSTKSRIKDVNTFVKYELARLMR